MVERERESSEGRPAFTISCLGVLRGQLLIRGALPNISTCYFRQVGVGCGGGANIHLDGVRETERRREKKESEEEKESERERERE